MAKSLTRERKLALACEIMDWLEANGLFEDVCIYVNGARLVRSESDGAARTANGTGYSLEPGVDVTKILEYCNPGTLTMTFEGTLYADYNYGGPSYDKLRAIAAKYGLYPEQGYAWSLALYSA